MLNVFGFYTIYSDYLNENYDDYEMMTKILLVLCELVFNKSNRISISKNNSSIKN